MAKKQSTPTWDETKPIADTPKWDETAPVVVDAKPLSFAEDPLGAAKEVGKQVGMKALQGLGYVGEKIDRFTGAPTRSAILAGMKGENPLSAYVKQFGRNTETAPTGKDIATLGGLSTTEDIEVPILSKWMGKVSPAGVAGLGVDLVADPTNFIVPGKVFSKGATTAGKIASEGGELALKIGAKSSDILTGTEFGSKSLDLLTKGKQAIESSAKGVAEGIQQFSNTKIDKDYAKLLKTVTDNGLPLDKMPVEFKYGDADAVSRLTKKIRETPTGAQELKDYYEFGEAVGQKIDEKINAFSGGSIPKNKAEAGDILINGYEAGVKKFFDEIDVTYKTPAQLLETTAPGVKMDLSYKASQDLGKFIEGFKESELKRSISALDPNQRSMAKQNATIGDLLSNRLVNGTYEDAVDGLRELGQIAFSATSKANDAVSYDKKALRNLYFKMSDEIVNTVRRTLGDKMAKSLTENNKKIHEFLKEKALVADILENEKLAPEKVFNRLIQNGDSKRVKVLVSLLPEKDVQQLRGAFLDNLVSRKVDDKLPLASLKKALDKKDPVASALFSPDELESFKDLIDVGNRLGDAVMSKSGTGASMAFENIPKSVGQGILDRSIREQLIKRSEGVQVVPQVAGATPASAQTASKATSKSQGITRAFNRGPRENILKASQVLSTKNKNEDQNSDAIQRRLRGR